MAQVPDLHENDDGLVRPECNFYQHYIIDTAKAFLSLITWSKQLEQSVLYIEFQEINARLGSCDIDRVTDLQFFGGESLDTCRIIIR